MAGYSLYDTYVVPWSKVLVSLDAILTKAEAHAEEKGLNADGEFIGARLCDDMLPLTFQIQTLSSQIKLPLGLLTGKDPEWPKDEKTFADLHARIKKTQDYISSIKPEDINGREDEVLKPFVALFFICLGSIVSLLIVQRRNLGFRRSPMTMSSRLTS